MVSVSAVPGGNPVARADPENWAVNYGRCGTCNAHWCDRCLAKLAAPECPKCKVAFIMFGLTPAAPAPGPSTTAGASAAGAPAAATRPWWKFWG